MSCCVVCLRRIVAAAAATSQDAFRRCHGNKTNGQLQNENNEMKMLSNSARNFSTNINLQCIVCRRSIGCASATLYTIEMLGYCCLVRCGLVSVEWILTRANTRHCAINSNFYITHKRTSANKQSPNRTQGTRRRTQNGKKIKNKMRRREKTTRKTLTTKSTATMNKKIK